MLSAGSRVTVAAAALVAAACLFLLTGCTNNEPAEDPTASPTVPNSAQPPASVAPTNTPSVGPTVEQFEFVTVNGAVKTSGAETVDGTFENSAWTAQESCEDAARNGSGGAGYGPDGAFVIPGPPADTPLSDGTLLATNVEIGADAYSGPADYRAVANGILIGELDAGTYYDVGQAASVSVTVQDDGSGSLTFTDAPAGIDPSLTLSGEINWTCSD